ncbi:hypothetical protein L1D33_03660 [Vibrio chagasii]|uniref:hypothetical protein n=1 Tax=Vibrio chagasii TaxID=170679 RepID=UPI001EFDFF5F|nr:hypothetical protein [Vibrio chagasii]MCG9672651.1 hypothetical protein [Vibrio chagasii]CAH7192184.1 conserved exported hypothetical protein [Vibrio chagasii]
MTASNTSNSFTALFRRSLLIGLASIAPTLALANPSSDVLDIYNQAAQGNEELVEVAYERLNDTLQQDGATPLTLVYLGSTETLMGRDAFLPWNKMKYVEKGLSTIDKSLGLLKDEDQPIHEQPRVQGLPDSYLTRAMAAVTYTSLPDMFNHFDRGYDLFLSLLSEDEFQQQHFSATSWIYRYAITASIRAEDLTQAQTWLKHMEMADADNIETMTAKALIAKAK